jgi:hypothetical protein
MGAPHEAQRAPGAEGAFRAPHEGQLTGDVDFAAAISAPRLGNWSVRGKARAEPRTFGVVVALDPRLCPALFHEVTAPSRDTKAISIY